VDPTLLDTIVLAQQVDGIAPGLYDLDPQNLTLALRREGDFREAFGYACLGQEIGRDAAAVVIHVADLARAVKRYGDRAYRYLHLDAGHLGQRMNLAATSVRLGVSGIAGFFDEELSALLELPGSAITVYITTLGQSL
jgi:SagB-type dehydrogenase family enzyme